MDFPSDTAEENYYNILDLSSDASPEEIRSAYLRAKLTYSKDNVVLYTLVSPEEREEALQKIEAAYKVLSDPDRRKEYDQNFEQGSGHFLIGAASNPTPAPVEAEPDFFSIPVPADKPAPAPTRTRPSPVYGRSSSSGKVQFDSALTALIQNEKEWGGGFIKNLREACGMSLEELSEITKISKAYLAAVEEENFAKLPAPVFLRGFIMQISRVLKLPQDSVAQAYMARHTAWVSTQKKG